MLQTCLHGLVNDGRPTFQRPSVSSSRLDFAVAPRDTQALWSVEPDTCAGDHYLIRLTLTHSERCLTWRSKFNHLIVFRLLVDKVSGGNITLVIQYCLEATRRTLTLSNRAPHSDKKHFNLREARRRAQRHACGRGTRDVWITYNKVHAVLRRLVLRLQRNQWCQFCESLGASSVSTKIWLIA